jgi:putative transposase
MVRILVQLISVFVKYIQTIHKSKKNLILENLALRRQLPIYQTKKAKLKINNLDRFKTILEQMDSLIIVKPETIIDWQNRRFKKHWTKISTQNKKPGRKKIIKEIRNLIYNYNLLKSTK